EGGNRLVVGTWGTARVCLQSCLPARHPSALSVRVQPREGNENVLLSIRHFPNLVAASDNPFRVLLTLAARRLGLPCPGSLWSEKNGRHVHLAVMGLPQEPGCCGDLCHGNRVKMEYLVRGDDQGSLRDAHYPGFYSEARLFDRSEQALNST